MSKRGKDYTRDAIKLSRNHPSGFQFVFFEAVRAPTKRIDPPPQGDPPGEYGAAVRQLRRNSNSAVTQLRDDDREAIQKVRNGGGRAAFEKYFGTIWKDRNSGNRRLVAEGQRRLRVVQRYLPEYMPRRPSRKGVTSR